MKTLILLRHAKSAPAEPGQSDFDRPLSDRGNADAPRMAAWLAKAGYVPDLVLCSSAARTKATLALFQPHLPPGVPIKRLKSLYLIEANPLLQHVRLLATDINTVLLIGHNPGLEDGAQKLIGKGPKALRQAMLRKFPTAGIAVITFDDAQWADIETQTGTLAAFATPKHLSDDAASDRS
jgi:phosphohistidine phosphatase